MITGDILLAVITLGIALGVFQFIYTCVTYRAQERAEAENQINLKALYRLTQSIKAPVVRAIAARKPKPKAKQD